MCWSVVLSIMYDTFQVERFVMQQKDELMNRAKRMAKKSLGSIKTVTAYAGEKIEKTR